MPWPLASDFQTILQNPAIAFRDPYLRSCSIERDVLGQPRTWAGSFAVVYKGIDTTGTPVAIRVFSTESPHRHGRYDQIGDYLTARRLACLLSFEYREDEIRSLSDGKRYPILLMDWVEGETLFQWVRNQCRQGNAAALMSAARQWPAVAAELAQEQIAHGDLQHANIMVTPQGELKLVDYDGMCVPALVGAECLEFGTPPYQHPRRKAQAQLSLRLDDFSALLICIALHALAVDPALWGKYVEQTNNDKLLFREDDFRFPQKSALRHDLLNSARPYVREMTERLFAAAGGNLDEVPRLDEIIARCQVPAYAATDALTPPRSSATSFDPDGAPAQRVAAKEGAFDSLTPPQSIAARSDPRPPSRRPRQPGTLRTASVPNLQGYKMLAEVGRGVSSTVFLARSESTGQQVVVKIMPIGTPATEIARRRFLAEVYRAAQVRHPNIVALIERGTVGPAFYFVTEYCDGGDLAQWMESNGGKLKAADVGPVMRQCLDALKHAHLHRVLHGSITPQNVLLSGTAPRIARISDFGVAIEFEHKFRGLPAGTNDPRAAGFIPPERLTSKHGLNLRSDLWGLAAVVYYALTGCAAWDFRGREPAEVVPCEDPVPLRRRESSVPAAVAEVIDRALRPNPAQRFQSAAEMKAAWDAAFNTVF